MTTTNMALYRLLVKQGATEAEAEAAAILDTSTLATKADLADLKASFLMWVIVIEIAQTTLLLALARLLAGVP